MNLSLKTALRLGRVSNLPTVWSNVLAGVALAGSTGNVAQIVALCFCMTAFYVGGMYLNDAFDQEWDRKHGKDRPIAEGLVSGTLVLKIGFGLLFTGLFGVAILVALGASRLAALPSAAVLAGLIIYYNLHHKNNVWSPIIMGLCRVGIYVVASTSVAPATRNLWFGSALLLGHLIGLTYIAKHETRGRLHRLWPVLMFVPAIVAGILLPWPLLLLGAFYTSHTILNGVAPAFGWGAGGRPNPRQAVPALIAGISLLDAVLLSRGAGWFTICICLLAFALTRYWQRHVPGT